MPIINLPELDLSLFSIPKCGGTTLWHYCYFLRTGEIFVPQKSTCHRARRLIYEQHWMKGPPLTKKLVVIRDPVERFVSGYRNFRDKRGLKLGFDQFVDQFESLYHRRHNLRHHFRPQSKVVERYLATFDYVVPFSQYASVRRILESLSGITIPTIHKQSSRIPKPPVSSSQRTLIQDFYHEDYERGFCENSEHQRVPTFPRLHHSPTWQSHREMT